MSEITVVQTYKNDYFSKELKLMTNTWKDHFNYKFFNDGEIEDYIKKNHNNEYNLFKKLDLGVMKADFFRYIYIYDNGGLYTDIDTKLIDLSFLIDKNKMIIAKENDENLCQWTFYSPKNCEILKSVIDLMLKRLTDYCNKKEEFTEHSVHYLTGPGVFTDGIIEYFNDFKVENEKIRAQEIYDYLYDHDKIKVYDHFAFRNKYVEHYFAGSHIYDDYDSWTFERNKLTEKPVMLWISDVTHTGYSSASKPLLNKLIEENKYKIYVFAVNCRQTVNIKGVEKIFYAKKFDLMINSDENEEDILKDKIRRYNIFGLYDLNNIVNSIKPDYIFSINDFEVVTLQYNSVYVDSKQYKPHWTIYIPIDAEDYGTGYFKELKNFDKVICMTQFGINQIKKTGFTGEIELLPHTIKSSVFHKLDIDKKVLKQELFGIPVDKNYLVITNFNVYSVRKRIDLTIESYIKFIQKFTGNSLLILNGRKDYHLIEKDILSLEKKYGVSLNGKLMIFREALPEDRLNMLFNATDIGINTTTGEGWGLIPCEMALCGVPSILPNNSVHKEIFGNEYLYTKCQKDSMIRGRYMIQLTEQNFMCIIKGYKSLDDKKFDNNVHRTLAIEKSSYITNIIISPTKVVMENSYWFPSIEKFKKEIKNIDLGVCFQVLVLVGKRGKFILSNICENINLEDYNTYQVLKSEIETHISLFNQNTGVVDTDHCCDLLIDFMINKEKYGNYCFERMKIYSQDKVCNQFIEIINTNL